MLDIKNIRLSDDGKSVIIVDQTQLPSKVVYLTLTTLQEMYAAIANLRVRGAPAIGIFAAYALCALARQSRTQNFNEFYTRTAKNVQYLASSRPTAVNLEKQLNRMLHVAGMMIYKPVDVIIAAMRDEAEAIHSEDFEMCRRISEHGLTLIKEGDGILTHCNAGPLATGGYGTGLGTIILAAERGIKLRAYCDETRPLLQGARLTAFELMRSGVDTTLICDNMASIVMSEGKINACFVGCDRVARNGDTANKIGTSGVAILAKHYGIPFYVFCPSSTIDPDCSSGADIKIEQRPPSEITDLYYKAPVAPENVKCYNPAFDVTPAELITAIITEDGIYRYPYSFGEGAGN